jgi:hypothetical protein
MLRGKRGSSLFMRSITGTGVRIVGVAIDAAVGFVAAAAVTHARACAGFGSLASDSDSDTDSGRLSWAAD